jgi:glyoxylase-like metal-dependent hydrolase (beta-lactamase superfamily II)
MHEIVPDVWTWSQWSAPHGYPFNGYLVCDAGGNLCIDPVDPAPEDLTELTRRGVARILLTNRNHLRAANRVRSRTGARTAIHAADAAGEVALYWPKRRILFVGDALIGNPPGQLGLLREQVMDDPAELRQSVRRLLDLDFDAVMVGDGAPILQGARAALACLIEQFA